MSCVCVFCLVVAPSVTTGLGKTGCTPTTACPSMSCWPRRCRKPSKPNWTYLLWPILEKTLDAQPRWKDSGSSKAKTQLPSAAECLVCSGPAFEGSCMVGNSSGKRIGHLPPYLWLWMINFHSVFELIVWFPPSQDTLYLYNSYIPKPIYLTLQQRKIIIRKNVERRNELVSLFVLWRT